MYTYHIVCMYYIRISFCPTNKYKSRLIHYPVSEKKALITDVMRLPVMSALSREKIQTDRARVFIGWTFFSFSSFFCFRSFYFFFLCSYYYYRHQGPNFYLFIVAFLTLWKIYLKIKKNTSIWALQSKGEMFYSTLFFLL